MGNYRAMVGAALATIGAVFLAIWNWTVLDGVVLIPVRGRGPQRFET